ncbi:hypothetical protein BKA64DRAFT_666141 [Cadophora sp. MPI-SDFR-AT-0126]|nr:hypothetical protein BKA64DRAFT_666141 [Leotiomycetes sp. MPI-SDFR-AT-0126]
MSTPLFGETYLRSQDPKKMASPTSATKVYPSGISPPLEVVTATNRGGIIGVTTTVALAIVLLIALPTGMYIRIRSSAYRADYYIFLAAVLVFLLQTTAVYIELSGGFGKVMDLVPVKNWNRIDKAGYVADVLYLITMFLSKCSTASIFLRLTPGRGHSIAVKTILAAMTAWIVMAIFVICLRCQPAEPWLDTTNAECPNLYSRWAVIGALDMISELALFGMSLYLVWNIRMAMKSKLTVVGAFASRLPIIALAAVRLHYLHIQLDSTDPSFDAANTVALTQFELGYGIFACIIPVMKPFLASHEGPLPNEGYTGDNYNLSTFGGGKSNAKNSQFDSSQEGTLKDGNYNTLGSQTDVGGSTKRLKLRPEHTSYQAGASRHDKQHDTRSLDSSDSQLMIIQKNVDFTVQYDSTPSTADKVGKV